ncbi:TrbC/VirB2 family protein [Maribacter litopenaei]|uniref:TrbC/VirB2 family protein n=1 Tax=Maribacter litopenaei TaxID=2976127 RepID=A0ABY5Y612_9FLAO|nr:MULTISPECIES: TrbC/VirB2 family protein [Maribacter]UWX54319.1 TrbC/VirB2 family protein [Maribacter litopenaei]
MTIPRPTLPTTPKPKLLLLLSILLFSHSSFYGQFEELISETQEFQQHTRTLSNHIIGIIKMIAGVAVVISGLTYAYMKDQQSDLTTRLGRTVIGIAIFLALIAVGEEIAAL